MPKCPNCFYKLTLLKDRRKYKCSKCSKLFPQQEIDEKEFREFNKKQRRKEKEEARKEARKEQDKKYREAHPTYPMDYYEKHKEEISEKRKKKYREANKKWRDKNPGKVEEYKLKNKQSCKKYYQNNPEKFLIKNRKYRAENGQAIKERRGKRRLKDIESIRALNRIGQLRIKQKQLALQKLELEHFGACTTKIQRSLPTSLLPQLLIFRKDLNNVFT